MSVSSSLLNDIVVGSHESLLKDLIPLEATRYLLEERKLDIKIIKLFGIGFCTQEMEKIINRNYYDGKDNYPSIKPDFLKDKIIMPIKDDCGKLVSIATRSIGKKQSWWNTPFTKGNYLFGLNFARSRAFTENKLYLVEGYMDCCILHQYGLYNVAATMGVKFTNVHIALALRYCDRLCFCYDTDLSEDGRQVAGQEAADKALKKAQGFFNVSIIQLPLEIDNQTGLRQGSDPDEFVIKNGVKSFLSLERDWFLQGD